MFRNLGISVDRRLLPVALAVGLLVVLLVSSSFGRAVPTNNYRPDLPPDALATGCFPLPGGVRLDLPYQIRSDRDVVTSHGPRRELLGQYDLVDRDTAEQRIVASFTRAGFRPTAAPDSPGSVRLTDPHHDYVGLTLSALPGTSARTLVRGTFLLDLPTARRASTDPVCDKPSSTKRWTS